MDADETVVRRVLAGDRAAFGALIDRHRAAALRLARRIVPRVVNLARSRAGGSPSPIRSTTSRGGRPIHVAGLLDPMPSPAVVQETLEMHRLVDEAIAVQLRQSLIDTMVATGASRPVATEARMVEVTLEDVVVRVPKHDDAWWMTEQTSVHEYDSGRARRAWDRAERTPPTERAIRATPITAARETELLAGVR